LTAVVRRARLCELPICAAIYQRTLRETFTWLPAWRHNAQDFLGHAESEEVFVAADGGRILGLASVYAPDRFLHSLYVAERGRGVGRVLLDHLASVYDGPISLKCQKRNLRAQLFYLREGFEIVEEGVDPMPGGVAWVRLSR